MPADAVPWMRNEFAYNVVRDVEARHEGLRRARVQLLEAVHVRGEVRRQERLHRRRAALHDRQGAPAGKKVDVHCGGHNDGLRRMLAFDVDTLEHPFYGSELIDTDIIEGYVARRGSSSTRC